jgi:polyphosphate kinase
VTDLHLTAPASEAHPGDFRHPSLFLNRELSWLEFNRRVLHEAQTPTPLLERSVPGNFQLKPGRVLPDQVAGLKERGSRLQERTPDGLTPEQQLKAIRGVTGICSGTPGVCTRSYCRPPAGAGNPQHQRPGVR